MEWRDVADTVGRYAPGVGAALAGPAGAAVGSLVAGALGVEAAPAAVQAAASDPANAAALRKIEADLEQVLIQARGQVVTAEAQSESWLARNWRPITMLWFAALLGAYWFGFTAPNLTEATILALFDIVQVGLGGYVIGRSAEKVSRTLTGTGLLGAIAARGRK